MAPRTGLAGLLLLASVVGLHSSRYHSLREQPPSSCGFAHYGSAAGSAQRLVETHLAPGVADWNIVVPMPPPCKEAQVTGVDMRVCDTDAAPDVSMSDALTARVHRAGQLATFATVNVTVYCILPTATPPPTEPPDTSEIPTTTPTTPAPPPPTPPPPSPPPPPTSPPPTTSTSAPMPYLTDARSTYEMMSNELISNEITFNEYSSYESESIDLTSAEPVTTVKPTSTTTLAMTQEETTTLVKLTSPTEVVTPLPHLKMVHPKENPQHSLKVTINITPNNQESSEEDVSQSYEPSSSSKDKSSEAVPAHGPGLPSHIQAPPRFAEVPPRAHVTPPRGPGMPPLGTAAPHDPRGAMPARPRTRVRPTLLPPGTQYATMPSPYGMMAPPYNLMPQQYSVAPAYRPVRLISPWLRYLQRRQPVLFYHRF